MNHAFEEIVDFAGKAIAILGFVWVAQIVTILVAGIDVHHSIFVIQREHWLYFWTPFTSALSHTTPQHLLGNLSGIILYGGTAVALVGRNRALFGIYLAAVMGQLMGIASGKADLIGASAGVAAAAGFSVMTSPFWLRRLLPWGIQQFRNVVPDLKDNKFWPMYRSLMLGLFAFCVPWAVATSAGNQIAADVLGTQLYASFAWGTAPSGPVYTAHLFGLSIGATLGLAYTANHLWLNMRRAKPDAAAEASDS